ncbi:MAG TPA: hypothetical protein VIL74_04480 [Pyrinomonadaceae bacterium]|jgi:hypothetical protein
MRRYLFFILITLLTFGIGSVSVLKTGRKSQENLQTSSKQPLINKSFGSDFKGAFKNTFNSSLQNSEIETEKPIKPFCNDKIILRVWKYLVRDRDFQEWQPSPRESLDCKDMFEIKEFDLNQDGNKEILLRGKNFNLCSPVGNCGFWIYERAGKGYQKILGSTDYSDIIELPHQIQKNKTNGYRDVLLKGHFTASDTTYRHYKFIGKKYKLVKDLINACVVCTGDNPKWKMMTWKEYKKNNL